MSMSKKLTFSLASLVLILGLVFAIAPVMAQEDMTIDLSGTLTGETDAAGDAASRFTVIGANAIQDVVDTGNIALPDLELRFLTGTTIALLAPAAVQRDGSMDITGPADAVQAKDVVISEIMWGLDEAVFANRDDRQWIELYNSTTTSATVSTSITVDMANWVLRIVDTHDEIPPPADATVATFEKVKNVVMLDLVPDDANAKEPYILVDMVSNLAGGGWTVVTDAGTYGQSGLIPVADSTAVPKDVVSMYRNINYDNVTKDHKKAKQPDDRNEQLKAIPGGGGSGSWKKSTRAFDQNLVGTPGARHFKGAVSLVTASSVDRTKVIVNEIGNSATAGQDWVEFRNVSGDAYNLKNHHLSYVKGKDSTDADEASLINFKDVDAWIPKDGVLLVLASDPDVDSHPIAGGINIKDAGIKWDATDAMDKKYVIEDNTDRIPNGAKSLYYIDDGFALPDGDTLIILRNAHDKLKTDVNLLDVNGGLSIVDRAATHATSLWPLKKTGAAHGNVADGGGGRAFKAGFAWQKNTAGGGTGEKHWAKRGFTGIGYKRNVAANDAHGGTPGYDNGAASEFAGKVTKADGTANADYKAAPVTMSEIMYATGRNLPQWIELYNSSLTQGVNLKNWQLKLENMDDVLIRTPTVTVKFADADKIIPPNQTVLIVSTSGSHSNVTNGDDFPDARVINLWRSGLADRGKLEIDEGTKQRAFTFLSQTAFKVTLMNKDGEVVDTVGNMGADPAWDLPMAEEDRSSIIRRYDEGVARVGTMPAWSGAGSLGGEVGGAGNAGWILASESPLGLSEGTYYGNRTDSGTPGYRAGGPVPVSLSKFRPERLDSGAVVVRWITESELNNAGFNILRSETRDGEFTKLNTNLIAGQGTISERTVYEYADTSAKPNVVYYYQIQDVSLDGKVQTLRQNRLKGDISADGKLTTTWGELKLQD